MNWLMKSRIGILTDNTAQFTIEKYPGSQLVHKLPINKTSDNVFTPPLTPGYQSDHIPHIGYQNLLPEEEDIRDTLLSLNERYDEILIPVISKKIYPLYYVIEEIITRLPNSSRFHLIDSQSMAIGLGMIVQMAASSAFRNNPIEDIKKYIRNIIPKIYAIFCVKNLHYLYLSGLLDPAQAIIGEFLDIFPCLSLENGMLVPTYKARNLRHCIDLFLEFSSEFENVRNIALLHGDGVDSQDFHTLRSRIIHQFSTASFSEHTINLATASILGPQAIGLIIMETI